jgi:hypothetical protein
VVFLFPLSLLTQKSDNSSIFCFLTPIFGTDTHWGQQVFHLPSAIPLLPDQTTRIAGTLEMMRTKDSARLYNVRFRFVSSRRKTEDGGGEGTVLMTGKEEELVYQIP